MEILQHLNLDQAKAELCKRSLYEFVKEFWGTIIPETPIWNWHIEYLCNELQKIGLQVIHRLPKDRDVIINVPPSTSKSTICSIMFPCWLWATDPTLKIISASYTASLGLEQATKARTIIESEKYKTYYPLVVLKDDANVKSNYQTTLRGARYTTSTGGTVTGMHGNIIIVDDPQNPEYANSEAERSATNEWVSSTLSTRKVDKRTTVTMLIQQRLHPLDVTGYLLSKGKEYFHICLPAELNKTISPAQLEGYYIDGLLDPIRLSRPILDEMKVDLGGKQYSTQINQSPEDESNAIIKESWINVITQTEFSLLTMGKPYTVDFYGDTAYTEKKSNDPSAFLACTKIGEILYVLNISQVWAAFPSLIKHIKSWTAANGYNNQSRIKIEPKASGKSIVQQIKAETSLNVIESPSPTSSKLERLSAISARIEAQRVTLVQGSWNNLFLSEVTTNHPVHDDVRDTFIMAVEDKLTSNRNRGKYTMSFV